MNKEEIFEKIITIQENYALEDWSDSEIILSMCKDVWEKAQNEVVKDVQSLIVDYDTLEIHNNKTKETVFKELYKKISYNKENKE